MLEFIAGFVVGAATFYLMTVWAIRRLISKVMAEDAQSYPTDLTIRARVEQHNGMFYFYNNDSNEFLIQGTNLSELIDHLESRRAGVTVHIVAGDEFAIANLKALAK
jgi:hypothetical protein